MKHKIAGFVLTTLVVAAVLIAESASAQTYVTTSTGTKFVPGYPAILQGRDLSRGATGPDVALLQGFLIELDLLVVPPGVPLGYYGSLTASAVARYQTSQGVISTGYFGPLTKQAMTTHFSSRGWLAILWPLQY